MKYVAIDIYIQILLGIFPNDNREWIHRDRTGEVWFILKTFIGLENMINKSERLSNYLMENKKKEGKKDK